MLTQVTEISPETVDRLFAVYAESMADLAENFPDQKEMRSSYEGFLREFIAEPGQLILVETEDGGWRSALRAVERRPGFWFIEAVETDPRFRGRGFGRRLLTHTVDLLVSRGAKRIESTVHPDNTASNRLHAACGFNPTEDVPVNCWGETETGCVLWRYERTGDGKGE